MGKKEIYFLKLFLLFISVSWKWQFFRIFGVRVRVRVSCDVLIYVLVFVNNQNEVYSFFGKNYVYCMMSRNSCSTAVISVAEPHHFYPVCGSGSTTLIFTRLRDINVIPEQTFHYIF
jgi:hypothetical protein